MKDGTNRPSSPRNAPHRIRHLKLLKSFLIGFVLVTLALSPWLLQFIRFSLENTLYSHVLLIPAVCFYLAWQNRGKLIAPSTLSWGGLAFSLLALAPLMYYFFGAPASLQNAMAAIGLTFVLLTWSVVWITLGAINVHILLFPILLLVTMVPFPDTWEAGIESFLQHGSADLTYPLFQLSGITVLRENLLFRLPGITLEVARECSGIRSSLVLFIVSLVGGYLFLESPWRRLILAVAVIPLALLRNAFRIFVIGFLCVQFGRHMIDSWIHHQGGPIFFALSMIPFLGLVWFLMRGDRKRPPPGNSSASRSAQPAPPFSRGNRS